MNDLKSTATETHETKAEQMRRILDGMTELEKAAWFKEIGEIEKRIEAENNLGAQIQVSLKKVQKKMAEVSIDGWDQFCKDFNFLCRDIRGLWGLIDEKNHKLGINAAENHVKEMLKHGYKFDRISINDTTFEIREGKISSDQTPDPDDIPF